MGAGGGGGDVLPYESIPESLKMALFCHTHEVTNEHRMDNPYSYNFCIVPNSSYDVVLFGGLAVVLACLLQGKLNTLMVLVAGAVLMAVAFPVNLGALGNSLAIWLGISPWQLFFFVFLPPLLLDAAVRIDWFMFRKSFIQVFTLAFVVVGATCALMIPIMLHMLQLQQFGWNWIHACMFGAMIASTDAVAIVSIMKTSGGPKRMRVMLEGESLLNDASGLTLFEVFFHLLQVQMEHPEDSEPIGTIVGHVFLAVFQLGMIGFVMGMVFGMLTRLFLRFMRYMGAGHDQEVALTLGMAYLAYWITAIPCKGSGVVAVAVMGLYGAATNWWDMSTHAHETFDGFWETLAFVVNSLVFLYSGASVVNFFVRASMELVKGPDGTRDLAFTLWMMPVIYIILTLMRFGLTMAFRPLFIAIKGDMSFRECIFVCAAGLRGSASLIMGSAVVTYQMHGTSNTFNVVKAMMVFWTAGFVLLTLLINAPMLPLVLRLTGLSKVPAKQLARRQRAVAALGAHTAEVLDQLRDAEDELLAGVDWGQVASFVDHGRKYGAFTGQPTPTKRGKLSKLLLRLRACCCCRAGSQAQLDKQQQQQGQQNGAGGRSHHSRHSRHSKGDDGGMGSGSRSLKTLHSMNAPEDVEAGIAAAAAAAAADANGMDATANGASAADGLQRQRSGARRTRSGKRAMRRQQQQQQDGAVSDEEDSSVGSSSGSRAGSSSGSDSDGSGSEAGEGLLVNMMPAFSGFADSGDIDAMECPFMGFNPGPSRIGSHSSAAGAAAAAAAAGNGAAADPAAAAAAGGSSSPGLFKSPSMLLRKFWPSRLRKSSLPSDSGDAAAADEVQLQPLPQKQQPAVTGPADEPMLPAGPNAGVSGGLPPLRVPGRPNSGSGSGIAKLPSAFVAAAASRAGAAAGDTVGQLGSGSPTAAAAAKAKSAGNALRSLATRSAAPALAYAGSFGDRDSGSTADAAATRSSYKSSLGSSGMFSPHGGRDDSGIAYGGSSSSKADAAGAAPGWSLPSGNSGGGTAAAAAAADADPGSPRAAALGAVAAAAPNAGRPPAAAAAAAAAATGQTLMEKALGRPSGAYRGLATRSVNMAMYGGSSSSSVDRQTAGLNSAGPPAAAAPGFSFEGLHVPEGQEAVLPCGPGPRCQLEYDAAAAAVDMVALARSSGHRRLGSFSGPADHNDSGSSSGGIGVVGAAGGLGRPSSGRSLASRSVGMAGAYSSLGAAAGGSGRSAGGPGGSSSSSLATRSNNPHIPPVAPMQSSLYKVSTGLGGYKPGVSAAMATAAAVVAANSAGSSRRQQQQQQQGVARSLACRSVPVQQQQQAAARGRLLPSAADLAAAGQSNDVTNVSNEIRSGGAEPGSVLDVFSKALGRVSRISASMGLPGAAARAGSSRAGGPEGDSSDWDDAASSMYKASHGLGKNSSYGTGSVQGVGGVSEEELADARSWLLSGLKRYFYGKRMDGLLSAAGLRILDSACEVALEDPTRPLRLWGSLSRDAANNLLLRVLTMCLFACRRGAVGLHTIGAAGRWLSYPLRVLARMLQRPLNQVLLSSVEVAMEYLMGLTTSPYVEWLQEGEVWSVLISEIQVETAAVARFLVDREIEAPERYSAVQSYRVAMAVLRQQRLFVESLFESGMLDSAEQSQLAHPIEAAERRLELLGPCWKAPSLGEVLRQLPFMRGQSQGVIDFFIKYGHLLQLGKGSRLPEDKQLYIVQSGIVKVSYTPDLGSHQEYFLGAGGVFNLYSALTGEELPGTTDAVAQGNALGKGPVLFCFSAKGLRQLSAAAAAGDASYQQLELDMHRLGGLFLLERLQPQVELETSQALARLAPLHVRGDGRPAGARHKRASRQQRAAWVRGHLAALRCHLKQQLVKSELLVLPAGCAVAQESHVMLLQGSIQVKVADGVTVSDPAAAEVARWMVSAGRHTHQSILPWLWEVLSEDDLAHAPAGLPREPLPVTITAGPEGAVILVCPSAAEEAAMAAGTAAAAITAAGNTNNLMRMPKGAAAGAAPGSVASGPAGVPQQQQQLQNGSPRREGVAAANPLLRLSSVASKGTAATAAAAAARATSLASQGSANPFLRRTLATAAAADAVMEPLPGSRGSATAGAGSLPGASSLPSAAAAAPASNPLPNLSRNSPTTRDLARTSPIPIRRVSPLPLAGADIDNRAAVGISSSGGGAAAAAAAGGVGGLAMITSDGEEQLQQQEAAAGAVADQPQQQQQQLAAAAAARPAPRRTRSVKPLRAGGGKDAANLR